MEQNVIQVLLKYINDTEEKTEEVYNELKSLQCSKQEIASFIWTFIDLSKGSNFLNENANNRIKTLINYMAANSKKYYDLFFIILDRADTNDFPEIDQMRKSYAIVSKSKYRIEKYQKFSTNPEGFARLILLFFLRQEHPEDLIILIGEHKLDPDAVLYIIFDLIAHDKTYKFIPFLSVFYVERILPFVFNGIYNEGDNFYYCILYNLLHNKRVKYQNLWKVVGEPTEILSDIYTNYISAIKTHSSDLVVVRTILPGYTKEESYPSIFFEHENECKNYRDKLCHSFFFRLLAISQPFDFHIFSEISQFDPCLYPPIAEALSRALYTKFLQDPILFLTTQENLDYLSTLSFHCTENKLIIGICRFADLIPPYIFSNFILPSVSLNNCAWQLSIPVYNCIMHYPMHLRRQIYKKFSENQKIIGDSIISIANVTRKMTNILFKRLSTENIDLYKMKVARYFLICPSVSTEKLLDYLFTITNVSSVPFLIIADLSPLSLDYLFLEICDRIENSPNFSDWPIEIATFLGKTFSEHYKSMDLEGYITFLKIGLKKLKYRYLCLLKALITEMATVNYRGNLSKSDIELRTGENLLSFNSKAKIEDCDEFSHSTKLRHLQELLMKDGAALTILARLDHMLQRGDGLDPSQHDEARFTFITICDFLNHVKITDLSPLQLVNDVHLSLPAATRISRRSYKVLQGLAPRDVPSELFGRFWFYKCEDFHVPLKKFEEIENQFNIRIEGSDDQDFRDSLIFVREQLKMSMENQIKKVDQIRTEINSKRWFSPKKMVNSIYAGFVNHCIIPRLMFSQEDARFCALFIFSLAHFTDFQIGTFNRFFVKKLHFIVLAATFNEARCIGLFLSKLLKYNRDRAAEDELHALLVDKFEILLERARSNASEFLANKTIAVLDLISKDFPKVQKDEDAITDLLDALDTGSSQSVSTQVKSYFTNRKVKVAKMEAKRQSLFTQPQPPTPSESSESSDYTSDYEDLDSYTDDYSYTSSDDSDTTTTTTTSKKGKKKTAEAARSHFKNAAQKQSNKKKAKQRNQQKSLSVSASASKLDIESTRSSSKQSSSSASGQRGSIAKSSSTSRIKRSSSKKEEASGGGSSSSSVDSALRRRSSSSAADLDASSAISSSSVDPYMLGTQSALSGALSSYFSMPQMSPFSMISNPLLQMQLAAVSASASAAASNDLQQQQQQQQQQQEQLGIQQTDPNAQQATSQYPYAINPLFAPYYYSFK